MDKATKLLLGLGCVGALLMVAFGAGAYQGISLQSEKDSRVAINRIELQPVLSGLSSPLYVTHAHDGSRRLFIVEQPGRIKVLQPGATTATAFLDITSKVLCCGERGLLGLAFHPQFSSNRRFFVNYTKRGTGREQGATIVAEYQLSDSDQNVANPDSERILLTIEQPYANHNGGMIEFGPDGFLYIGMGDGGSGNDPENHAQNIEDLLGKMLRIDIDNPESPSKLYSSPSSNPFFGPAPGRDEIYAVGLRNPWRFSFDRVTGRIYAGDVGQNAIEEVDIITLGANYGWRIFEGTRCNRGPCGAGSIPPILEYANQGSRGRCSVTGGYVYRGTKSALPVGAYVYGDYCTGEVFLWMGGTQNVLLDTNLSISSFGEDEDGEIYVVNLSGTVHRIVNPDAPSQMTLYYPRLVSTNGNPTGVDSSEYTGLAVANLGSTTAALTFTAFDPSGALISGANITNPRSMTLAQGEQLPILDNQIFGAGLSGRNPVGWIKLESSVREVVGFFLMLSQSLSILDGADVSATTLHSFVLPEIEAEGFTQIHLANPNRDVANITLELVAANGSARASVPRTLNGNGVLAELLTALFPDASVAASDYIRVVSNEVLVPFEYLGKNSVYVMGLNGQDATAGASKLYCPQYVVGGPDWGSRLSIVNLDSTRGTVTLKFIRDDGTPLGVTRQLPIEGRGKVHIEDRAFFLDPGDTLTQGYVEITSDGVRLAGSVVFGDPGRRLFSSALPLVSVLRNAMVYSQVASNSTYYTGITILNPNDSDANATIELFNKSGSRIISKMETVPARQRLSKLLTEYFPSLAAQDITSGYIRLTLDRGVASFALFGTNDRGFLSAIPAQLSPN